MYLYAQHRSSAACSHAAAIRRFPMVSRVLKLMLLSSFLVSCTLLQAQTTTGTIIGTVQDSSGAVLANADVKLTLVANGTTRDAKTNDSGAFSAPVIPPGV